MPFDISGKKIDPQKGHSSPDKNEAGRALIPISPDSRENKPQISLPVAFCFFPSRSQEKEVLAGNQDYHYLQFCGWLVKA